MCDSTIKEIFYPQDNLERLDCFLSQWLNISRQKAQKLIKNQQILLNNTIASKNSIPLQTNDHITLLQKHKETPTKTLQTQVPILYEDESLLVVNKPAGLLTHRANDKDSEETLVDILSSKDIPLSLLNPNEKWRSGIVHRLDKFTSGVLILAKDNTTHLSLQKEIKEHNMGRYYLAIIDKPLKSNLIIDTPIKRHPKNRLKYTVAHSQDPQGKPAKTAFTKIATSLDSTQELIAAKLFSGRTHQIRVHLAKVNRHILGDRFYGFIPLAEDFSTVTHRVFLHAHVLYFTHPKTQDKMVFFAPIPQDMLKYCNTFFPKAQNVPKECNDTIPLPSLFSSWIPQ